MPINVTCQCGKEFLAKEEFLGARLRCPTCGASIAVADSQTADSSESSELPGTATYEMPPLPGTNDTQPNVESQSNQPASPSPPIRPETSPAYEQPQASQAINADNQPQPSLALIGAVLGIGACCLLAICMVGIFASFFIDKRENETAVAAVAAPSVVDAPGLKPGVAEKVDADSYPQEPKTEAFLQRKVTQWNAGVYDNDPAVRRETFAGMLPTQEDLKTLYPEHGEKMWVAVDHYHSRQLAQSVDSSPTLLANQRERFSNGAEVILLNLRTDTKQRSYDLPLKFVPPDTPVYRAIIKGKNTSTGQSAFLYVNGRWVFFKMFGGTANLIQNLDRVVAQIEQAQSGGDSESPAPPIVPTPPPNAEPVEDLSLNRAEWEPLGLPDIEKHWSLEDHIKASEVVVRAAKTKPTNLPHFQGKKSGPVFAKLISPLVLQEIIKRTTQTAPRSADAGKLLDSVGSLVRRYATVNNLHRGYGPEMVELTSFLFAVIELTTRLDAQLRDEFEATNPFQQNEKQLADKHLGVIGMYLTTSVYIVNNQREYSAGDRIRVIQRMGVHFPQILPRLPKSLQFEVMSTLERFEQDPKLHDVKPHLSQVLTQIKRRLNE